MMYLNALMGHQGSYYGRQLKVALGVDAHCYMHSPMVILLA